MQCPVPHRSKTQALVRFRWLCRGNTPQALFTLGCSFIGQPLRAQQLCQGTGGTQAASS